MPENEFKFYSFQDKFVLTLESRRPIEILRKPLNKEEFPISNLSLCTESKKADNRLLLPRKYRLKEK